MAKNIILGRIKRILHVPKSLIPMTFVGLAGIQIYRTYKVHSDFKVKSDIKVKLPPNLTKIQLSEMEKVELREQGNQHVEHFLSVMLEKMPQENLILLRNNITNLKVVKSNFMMILGSALTAKSAVGVYAPRLNRIFLYSFDRTYKGSTAVYHELMHMASSYYDEELKNIYAGFRQTNIGDSLNEGYTQLLTERYFNNEIKGAKLSSGYQLCRNITGLLEKIVGQEKMENLYFNANLKGLIKELAINDEVNNVIEFIQSFDYVLNNIHYLSKVTLLNFEYKLVPGAIKMAKTKLQISLNYLLKWFIRKKINEEITDKNILMNELNSFYNEIINALDIKNISIDDDIKNELKDRIYIELIELLKKNSTTL